MRAVESVTISRPRDEVFSFAADFNNLPRWDWSVAGVTRPPGPIGLGTHFLVALRGRLKLDYEVIHWDPPSRMMIRAETPSLVSEDILEVMPAQGGCRLTYTAQLRLKGPRRLVEPAFKPLFELQGRVILTRLARLLERGSQAAGRPIGATG